MEEIKIRTYPVDWYKVLVKCGIASSMNNASQLVKAGALFIDGVKTQHRNELIPVKFNQVTDSFVVRCGKKMKKIVVNLEAN